VLAQRLVRRLCQKCKREVAPTAGIQQLLAEAYGGESPLQAVFEGKGCAACRKTGYRGRTGIHEMLLADEEMFASNGNDLSLPAIRRAAEARGMTSMLHDCVEKVRAGIVSAEALYEVLGAAGEPDQPVTNTPEKHAA
jgi:type II secretory ATPase GspE/PulE/Tfp pilus assembly ATPase PilB-like protein